MQVLRDYFGHDGFRDGQERLVDGLLAGRDVLGIMPTGAGKSVCYQIPAILREGTALVVSPLISLMKDQVASLIASGVPAAYLNSSLTPQQLDLAAARAAEGRYRVVYVAPERLDVPSFRAVCQRMTVSLVAVDEAHCVSQWGQDFRPNYLRIADFIAALPERPPVGAFTATATDRVRDDIVRLLGLRDPETVTTGFDRPNLFFEVVRSKRRDADLLRVLKGMGDRSGIVYCATRKNVEHVCDLLRARGVSCTRYHAGLDEAERRANQEDFQYDRARVMAATNAFGMGIDKSNVGFVIHYNMPRSVEAYYQEAGRAGRDGAEADCVMLYNPQDIITARWMMDHSEPNPDLTPQEQARVREQDRERLRRMIAYAETDGCLRANLLSYFGQAAPEKCGACAACAGPRFAPKRRGAAAEEAFPDAGHPGGLADGPEGPPVKKARKSGKTAPEKPAARGKTAGEDPLFEALRACRREIAEGLGVPPYVVCDDKTLRSMAKERPTDRDRMLAVHGMGLNRVGKFGDRFIEVIRAHAGESPAPPARPAKTWTARETDILRRGWLTLRLSESQLAALFNVGEEEVASKLVSLRLKPGPSGE